MTSEEIYQLVLSEVNENWDLTNLHGLELRECIAAPPFKKTLTNSFYGTQVQLNPNEPELNLWVVLRETPKSDEGYLIVYDEHSGQFGLATSTIFLNFCESFKDAFEGM